MAYQANACGMVPDVGFISPLTPLPIGIGRDWSPHAAATDGQCSVLVICRYELGERRWTGPDPPV